jgi:gamma-glutamyl-gamma-aminobutyrate hydrolase PuuD
MPCETNLTLLDNQNEIGLVVFTGGSDISPHLYNRTKHHSTYNAPHRDKVEVEVFEKALAAGIPMAGICRGAQFLCAMAGGQVVQDITGHAGANHLLTARWPDGRVTEVEVTSSHHQMQNPYGLSIEEYDVLAWSTETRSHHYITDAETKIEAAQGGLLRNEPDVVWYPKIKALAAQYHPEWMEENSDGVQYFRSLVDHYLVPLIKEPNDTEGTATSQAVG